MGLFSRLKQLFAGKATAFISSLAQQGYSYENRTLASNETIFSAISILSNDLASLPLTLRNNARKVLPDEHSLSQLFEYGPCPNFTAFEFIRCMEVLRNTTGSGYALKEPDNRGNVIALWPMKTGYVTPMVDRDTRELYYRVCDDLAGEDVYLHNSFIVSVSHISTDGIHPVNPMEVLFSTLDYDREVKEFSVNQMKNGLRANIVIKWTQANLDQKQIEEYNRIIRTFKKSGILYLDKGKDFTQLTGSSLIDPKVFEVENITIARVARVFNIPLDRFLPEKSSYSSSEQSDLNYLRDTLQPMARMYEQELDKKLLSLQDRQQGYYSKFFLGGFARADTKTRGEYYQRALRSSWMCQDEVRELEDMPPLPGGLGKEFFISKDMVPIRRLLNNPKEGSEDDV